MPSTETNNWLQAGITAAKAGDNTKAHELLMNVLHVDEENELAWLWLSGVVKTTKDRRICLENVLTINPDNTLAKRGLDKLASPSDNKSTSATPQAKTEEKVLRREHTPVSPASAILYSERQIEEVRWQEPVVEQKAAQAEYRTKSKYDDVWSRNEDICAYCAHQIAANETRCSNCKRNLISKRFIYPEPTSSMHVYWVLLVGIGQLFLIESIVDVLLGPNYWTASGYLFLMVIFWALALGVYFRQSWAHISSIFLLLLVLIGFMINTLVEVDLSALGLNALDSSIRDFVSPLVSGLLSFLAIFEVATAVFGLFYGIFRAGPDFERKKSILIATVTKGRRNAADYHNIARRLSERGLWATAVLHWQRASAQEPGQVAYQKQLGLAYTRLGFYQRGLDVLQTAHDMSNYPPAKTEIAQQIIKIKQKLTAQSATKS